MDYLNRVFKAIEYIEDHLGEDIGLPEAASAACFSPFHFHRIFEACVGDSAAEYIRKRRLTKAADDLLTTKKTIMDIALDTRYESQESFTRAFTRMYHVTPGRYRKSKINAINIDCLTVTKATLRHLRKGVTMEPKIYEIKPFKAVGIGKKVTLKTVDQIPKIWEEFIPRIKEIKKRVSQGITYGVCEYCDFSSFDENTPYEEFVCCAVSEVVDIPAGMKAKDIAGGRYAVFTHKGGLDTLRKTYDYIYSTWLPNSGYEMRKDDDFELYDERFIPNDPESEMDIYVPVK